MIFTILVGVLLLLSVVVNIFTIKFLRFQLKKVELYEGWIGEYEQWLVDVRTAIGDTYLKMKALDAKEIFFKDDEVGVSFSSLLELLKRLNDRIQ
jgi:hypothetical protein